MGEILSTGGVIGGAIAILQISHQVWKSYRGGELRKGQAEAAKATLDVTQAEASLPHVTESLKLGNVAEAVAVQQQVINGLRAHAEWADLQLQAKEKRIAELEDRLTARDLKIQELEDRLNVAEDSLNTAKRIIDELRETSRTEQRGRK